MIKTSMHELFDFDEPTQEQINKNKPILLIDGHNLAYRTVFSAINQVPTDNDKFIFWKHLMISSIFNMAKKFQPCKIVLAFDGYREMTWRKKIYPEYKAHRKQARDKSVVDFVKFYPAFNELIDEIKQIFTNIYTIKLDGTEGDDIIAILSTEKFVNQKIIIVSSDKDMNQLLKYDNITQFDPIKNRICEVPNPKKNLLIKIISGDPSDNIKPVRKKVGVKTAEKFINEGIEETIMKDAEMKKNYLINLKIIDFEYIPKDINKLIMDSYESYKISNINTNELLKFFTRNRMVMNMNNWQTYGPYIKSLS
jgi:5'-3' exonuclease